MLSLGCPKNEVDSDALTSALLRAGWTKQDDLSCAEVLMVNTCSFIVPAVEESIEAILEMGELKRQTGQRMVVAGCLVARYGKSALRGLLPEVDLFLDFDDYPRCAALMAGLAAGRGGAKAAGADRREHASTLGRGYVYLKICEGCRRRCAYCAIPGIRGPLRSRPREEIAEEAQFFLGRGARELILIAQDTTSYGMDIYGRPSLHELIGELRELEGDWWLRVMYAHPEGLDAKILRAMDHPRVCRYLDLPLQHADARVLRAMGRKGDAASHRRLLDSISYFLGECALRATFMVGFPGEDGTAFGRLRRFVAEARFDWLGLFRYSQEEGTPAFSLGKGVKESASRARLQELAAVQEEIMRAKALHMVGRRMRVLVEGESAEAPGFWEARSFREAPEVDGTIFIPHEAGISPGTFREVRIRASEGIDLIGTLERGR